MDVVKLEVLKDFGKLSLNGYIYFRLTNWQGNIMYELRGWKENGKKPFENDVKFSEAELKLLYDLLKTGVNTRKSKSPIHILKKKSSVAKVYNYFGELNKGISRQFTYTDWGYGLKYDIRHWELDFSDCWQGVRMSEEECLHLISILKNEFGFSE